jgi:1-acylglycerone phosphate reductase
MTDRKKAAIVTGCSSGGIGDALARELHSRGYRVFATARKMEKMKPLQELGCDCLTLDVEDEASIKAAAEHVRSVTEGKLDLLVNNAGKRMSTRRRRPSLPLCALRAWKT